jgi:uncharacterized phage protein (TIGR01671 family)
MTRPIKFKIFVRPDARVNQSYFEQNRISRIFEVTKIDFCDELISFDCPSECTVSLNEVEIMQFTGLHDKERKEIYEGDILKYTFNFMDEEPDITIDVVNFEYGCFLMGDEGLCNFCISEDGKISDIEIIGNKFTHPELLEK